jgi:hypothetical protein
MRRALVALCAIAACRVNLGDDKVYSCSNDGECGGDGYVCVLMTYCCKTGDTEAAHGCDGIDNDCNGKVDDGAGMKEICNGLDDDCDGVIDNGFNLLFDRSNCGRCGFVCDGGQACLNGACATAGELSCSDGIDNDGDGLTDCADPDCADQFCGIGCQCHAGVAMELMCNDGVDNDRDGKTDCDDPDCAGMACGMGGCVCSGHGKQEIACADGVDNDGDGLTDCLDPDCAGQLCKPMPTAFTCVGTSCACGDGGIVAETGVLCRDRVDNDCNGLVDCQEAACNGQSCALDGGAGCLCTGGAAKETLCADRKDNDNDGFTDCADSLPDGGGDCPIGTMCTYLNTGGMVKNGTCRANHMCQ